MRLIYTSMSFFLLLSMFVFAVDKHKAKSKSALEKELDNGAPELTGKASEAIEKAFKFLIDTQASNGSWRKAGHFKVSAQSAPEGNTGLVLLAFMVKGHFPGYDEFGDALDRGKKYLLNQSKKSPDGYLGHSMYEHALATLALSEMWGMTKNRDDDDEIQDAVEAAIKVILRSQDPRGSWTYTPMPHLGDTSITIMQLVTLASARQAGIHVPDETIDRGVAYLKSCQNTQTGAFAYVPGSAKGTSKPCSAAAAYVLHLCNQRDSDMLAAGMDYLNSLPDDIFKNTASYYYLHYYGMQAMVQDSDESYSKWYPKVREGMLARQQKDGSFIPQAGAGGKPQSTAMAVLTLGTPHRFLPIYQR